MASALSPDVALPVDDSAPRWGREFAARAGDKVTCPNGHEIATVLTDIRWGDINYGLKVGRFTANASDREPLGKLASSCLCRACGESWYRSGPSPFYMNGERKLRARPAG